MKGHAGHAGNERCDALAVAEIEKLRARHTAQEFAAALVEFKARQTPEPAPEFIL